MSNTNKETFSREELLNTLIDLFGIREPIEAYLEWSEMPYEDLLYIYNCQTAKYGEYDDYGDCYD